MELLYKRINEKITPVNLIFALLLLCVVVINLRIQDNQQYKLLAESMLHGKLYFESGLQNLMDTVYFKGNYYWTGGPFPIIITLPFVLLAKVFNFFFYQSYLQIPIIFIMAILLYQIARKLKYSASEAIVWASAFCFASPFLGVAAVSWSYFFAQILVVFLLFLTLFEYLNSNRPFVLGLIFGFIILTRATAALNLILFLLLILSESDISFKKRIKNIIYLLSPFLLCLIIWFLYNYMRFNNIFDQGYAMQNIFPQHQIYRNLGVFGLVHLPRNLYYFLIQTPELVIKNGKMVYPFIKVNPWGMSIFLTSPYFLYLFVLKYKDLFSKLVLLSVFLVAIPIFFYYGVGFRQFGYRYSLDFLPLLFFLLMKNYKIKFGRLSKTFIGLIVTFSLIDFYLMVTAFAYP